MDTMESDGIRARIEKDIAMFDTSVASVNAADEAQRKVVEMSKLYARDSRSYLEKGDYYTSFSCISYAHGLLDAIKSLRE